MRRSIRQSLTLTLLALSGPQALHAQNVDWARTGGDAGNTRYSTLDQIDRGNVARLRIAWVYHTGDLAPNGHGEIQATPIVVGGVLYTTTPALAVVALRADSGTLLWRFDPFGDAKRELHVNRGLVYWASGNDRRILFTAGRRLYALDARTGHPVRSFGDSGSVDLAKGLSRPIHDEYVVATSPGVVYQNLLIQGTRVGEEEGSAPGDIRAYDVRTGAIRWTFHTIPHPGEFGYDTWPAGAWKTAGGANSWPGMTLDARRGVVYIPTGSATPDFYGGARTGANLFANTLLALDARTGRRLWHFQTVHHDLWDRDLPAAPNLVTVVRNDARVDAVAQIAKSGFVFLFDRVTGRPLFPIEERPVPASDLKGEHAWPTQPFPTKPAPFARQAIADSDVTAPSLARFRTLRHGSLFTPPSVEGTVVLPGFDGGGEWGGAAVDPDSGMLFVNASDVPWIAAMRPAARLPNVAAQSGRAVYESVCASCHGMDRRGRDRAPSLMDVARRLTVKQAQKVIEHGRGFMPAFASLTDAQEHAVLTYLGYTPPAHRAGRAVPARQSPYEFVGYERWRDSSGYPAIKPPWGTLSAIDLNTGAYRWRIPLGEHAELGEPATGAEQYGGPIVTRGGLLFIAATQDGKFRAFDEYSGKLLWEITLPAPGYATPSTYMVNGRQYVVIAAGGGKLGSPSSDTYVAYALPGNGAGLARGLSTADSLVAAAIEHTIPGAVLLVAQNGKIVHERAFGWAQLNDFEVHRLARPRPMHTSTLFDLASVTKVMATTMAVMMLASEGRVDVDAPVYTYLPDFRGVHLDSITVRHLLTHSAGLVQWQPLYYHASNERETYDVIRQMPLQWGVGEGRHYSDLGFMLLGYIVEHVTHQPLDRFVHDSLYTPLGLRSTTYLPKRHGFTDFAATEQGNGYERHMVYDSTFGYRYRGDPTAWNGWRRYVLDGETDDGNAWYANSGVAGHAGLFSTAADLHVLIDLLLAHGSYGGHQYIRPQVVDRFLTRDPYQNFLGWMSPNGLPEGSFSHTGFTGTYVLGVPKYGLSIVLLTNRQNMGTDARGYFPDVGPLQAAVSRAIVAGAAVDAGKR